jgi:hypothetical protein
MMKSIFAPLAAALVATAATMTRATGAPPDAATTTFRPAAGAGWGGQTLVAPRPLYLTTKPAAKLASVVVPKGASILFGALDEKTALAQVRFKDGTVRVFLDKNGDHALSADEGLALRKGVVRWPACKDDLSAVVNLQGRTAVVWSCRAPNILFWAWRGFLKGEVTLEGAPRPAFLVDGNANGTFGEEKGDLLWIDRNGDGNLDPATEQFPCAPVLRIGGQMVRFAFQPKGAGGTAQYARVERGVGRRTVAFAGDLSGRIVGVEGTLLSQADDIIRAESPGQELEMPAGSYALTSLALRASSDGKPGVAWSYSFSRTLEGKDTKNFPVGVEAGNGGDLALYRNMTLGMEANEAVSAGEELKVQLSAKTEMGLELNNVRRAGQGEYQSPEDFATITVLDPAGKAVGEAHTGFA